ncbi:MAG: hypothetical protein FWC91_12425, partial [Defluviitaleaceae bacterium]|nr:hypothetical protein [Defluviitaleaceae bacterium]
MSNRKIEYYLNKGKIIPWFLLLISFEAAAIWLLLMYFDFESYPNILYQVICIIAIISFGFIITRLTVMLINKKHGIVMDHTGITVNSNFIHIGHISWKEIEGIKNDNVDFNSRGGRIKDNYIKIIVK